MGMTGAFWASVAHADEITSFAGDGPSACPDGYAPLSFTTAEMLETLCRAFFDEDTAQQETSYRLAGAASISQGLSGCLIEFDDPTPQSQTICESLIEE